MGYSIHFFAMDAKALAGRFLAEGNVLVELAEKRIREEGVFDEHDIQSTLTKATEICQGKLPPECDAEYFDALCWLAEATSEKVHICSLNDFRRLSYLDAIGIWPWLERFEPPFAVPRGEEDIPKVGFLPAAEIESFALPEFARLPATSDRDVVNARDEFRDVLETLVPDGLDLLAVLM